MKDLSIPGESFDYKKVRETLIDIIRAYELLEERVVVLEDRAEKKE